MWTEIAEIPEVAARVLAEPIPTDLRLALGGVRAVTFVGRGTSEHAAVFGRYLFEIELGLPAGHAAPSTVTLYGARVDRRGTLVVALSQSGRSPDLVEFVRRARLQGAVTVVITNDVRSPLAEAGRFVLDIRAGQESAVAATKSYVAQLAMLLVLVRALGGLAGTGDELGRLPHVLERSLAGSRRAFDDCGLLDALTDGDRLIVLGRGYGLSPALETALKLTETCRLFAIAHSAADFEHGPVVLAGSDSPVVAFRSPGRAGEAVDGVVHRVAGLGSPTWVIGAGTVYPGVHSIEVVDLPPEPLSTVVLAVPGLVLTERVSVMRGLDPDAPAGLTKITETR